MLAGNTQEIQEQASSSCSPPETLQRAFDNLFTTMDGIDTFRSQANENFLTTVNALEQQVQRAQPYLDRMNQDPDEGMKLEKSAQDRSEERRVGKEWRRE